MGRQLFSSRGLGASTVTEKRSLSHRPSQPVLLLHFSDFEIFLAELNHFLRSVLEKGRREEN